MAVRDLSRRAARCGDPNGLLGAGRIGTGVGIGPPGEFQVAAAHVDHSAAVGRPPKLADVDAVVVFV